MPSPTVDYGTQFVISLKSPKDKPPDAQALKPSADALYSCRFYQDHLSILGSKPGWTKFFAYLLGPIGAFLFGPLFGAATARGTLYTLPWDQLEWVRYTPAQQEISLCAVRQEDGKTWVCAFSSEQHKRILRNLAAFATVEGYEPPVEATIEKEIPREESVKIVLDKLPRGIKHAQKAYGFEIITWLAREAATSEAQVVGIFRQRFAEDEKIRLAVKKEKAYVRRLVDQLVELDAPEAHPFAHEIIMDQMQGTEKEIPILKWVMLVSGVLTGLALIPSILFGVGSLWAVTVIAGLIFLVSGISLWENHATKQWAARKLETLRISDAE